MQEAIEKILTILHGTWRFRWSALLIAWIIAPLGWFGVSKIPDVYEASAEVYVDSESILKPMLRGIALDSIDPTERLGMMTTSILSRSNLEMVLISVDLDVNAMTPADREASLKTLEGNILITATRTHRSSRPAPPNLYTISARDGDPETAYKIVTSLLDIFIEQTLGDTRKDTQEANKFLDQQIAEYEAKLVVREERLRKFKQENIDRLPESGNTFIQRIQQTQARLEEIELELREERNRRNELLKQIDQISPTQIVVGPNGQPILSPLDQRIIAYEERLDELRLKFTEQHPDVIEAQAALDALKTEKEQRATGDITPELASNPMYQQLRITLGEVEANIAALEVRQHEYRARLRELRAQAETLPKVEAELLKLQRDYDEVRTTYNNLIQRRNQADISEQADQTGGKTKLEIIERPIIPATPISPNRFILNILVLMFSIVAGLGFAFLMSQIKPAFYGQRMLKQTLDLPVLGGVSMLSLPSVVARRKLQLMAFFLVGSGLIAVFAVVMFLGMRG